MTEGKQAEVKWSNWRPITLPLVLPLKVNESVSDSITGITLKERSPLNNKSFGTLGL